MLIYPRVRIWALIAVLLICPCLVRANIGDALDQLRAHYGSTTSMAQQLLFEVRLIDGRLVPARDAKDPESNLSVTVYLDADHSAMEIFTRNTTDPAKGDLTSEDVEGLLAAASDGLSWKPIEEVTGRTTWVRSDNKLIARFSKGQGGQDADGAVGASILMIMVNHK